MNKINLGGDLKLLPGDLVDIIAPSSLPQNREWKKGLAILESWGLKVRFSEESLKPWSFHSGTNKQRWSFLKRAFQNSQSKAVWCLRGGYGSQKLLGWFKTNPPHKKLFIGFSDATAIHLQLNKWGWPSLHGPFISDIPYLSKKNQESLRQILFGEKKEQFFENLKVFHPSKKKILKGSLMGGNLTVIQTSLGCSWFPKLHSHFLFLEDVNEEAYRLDRALHHLFFTGALKGVKALILGSFHPAKSAQIHKVLNSLSEFLKIPMVTDLPCGHLKNNQPLPFKTPCELRFLSKGKACLKVHFPSYTDLV